MTHADDTRLVMNVTQLARAVGKSEAAIRSLVQRGELPARRWGRRVVFLTADLDAYFQQLPVARRAHPTPARCGAAGAVRPK